MLRTMLRPRWLGLFVVLLVALAACTLLGLWQLNVAKDTALREAVDAAPRVPVVAIDGLLAPYGAFPGDASGRRVSATGHYDATGQVVVPDRRLDGASGSWVITPLVVDSTGARVAVLRGFVEGTAAPAPTTTGTVTVVGSVAPGESPVAGSSPPPGQLASVDLARLVNVWPGRIYNAFLFAISETPDATGAAASLGSAGSGEIVRVPPPPVPSGLNFRNAAYAVQWWVFGLFAAWMWWRMVREDHLASEAAEAGASAEVGGAGADPPALDGERAGVVPEPEPAVAVPMGHPQDRPDAREAVPASGARP